MPFFTPNMDPPTQQTSSTSNNSCQSNPSCPNRQQDSHSTVRLMMRKKYSSKLNAETVTIVRRSRRLAGQSESSSLVSATPNPTGQEALHKLPDITTNTTVNYNNWNDFELAQFLSPSLPLPPQQATPVVDHQSNTTDVHDLLAQLFSTNSLGMDSMPRTPTNTLGGGMVPAKEEHDISQYLTDFFSTLPAAPVTSIQPAYQSNHPTSIAMSNAFKSLSPAETSPFFFDQDVPPMDTPALEPDDGDISSRTSPMWQTLSLFPDQPQHQEMPKLPAFYSSFADNNEGIPQTISPVELSLPLPSFDKGWKEPAFPFATPSAPAAVSNSRKRAAATSPAFDIPASSSDAFYEASSSVAPAKRKRVSATTADSFNGTRHTSIPLLDESAPTQKRNYVGPPSKTSKRPIPAAAARKVAALLAQSSELSVPIEEEITKSIEEKRRQNTVAARRSRQRKAEHLMELEETNRVLEGRVGELELQIQVWMGRALAAGWTEDMRAD